MTTLTIDTLQPDDLDAMAEILAGTVYTNGLTRPWLRYRSLGDPSCPSDLCLAARNASELMGFVVTRLRSNEAVVKMFAVRPEFRRQGVGNSLFDELDIRLRQRRASKVSVGAVGPNYFVPGVDLRSTDAISFLSHRGYETDRGARVDMSVDLSTADLDTAADEERLGVEGISIDTVSRDALPDIAEMALRHFSASWRFELLEAARFAEIPAFAAWQSGDPVSFAVYDVTGPCRFGPTGTRPDYRRQGIGGVLLKRCLRALRDRGEAIGEISWAGPIGYYARAVDARIDKSYWIFTKELDAG